MREQNTKDVKKEFLTTAFDYLVKHGLENTSVRDLCKETKISYGSIYYWFDGKDDIYINATKYGISKVAEALFDYAFEAMKDMKSFCDGFLDEVDKYKDEFRLIFRLHRALFMVTQYGQKQKILIQYTKRIQSICQRCFRLTLKICFR